MGLKSQKLDQFQIIFNRPDLIYIEPAANHLRIHRLSPTAIMAVDLRIFRRQIIAECQKTVVKTGLTGR